MNFCGITGQPLPERGVRRGANQKYVNKMARDLHSRLTQVEDMVEALMESPGFTHEGARALHTRLDLLQQALADGPRSHI